MSFALITGASHGIGKAIARELARAGFNLYINCKASADELFELAEELSANIKCIPLVFDISVPDEVRAMYAEIAANGEMPSILVNNAGISHVGLLHDMTDDEWQKVIGTNLSSVFYCCRGAIPSMVNNQDGRIINISSMWGNVGASCEVAYSASKGGVNSFTRALAKELAPSQIQVNAIACGAVDTRMNRCFSDAELAALEEEIPVGRMARPEEIAEVVLQLATGPKYMTGQVISVDGGYI